MKKPVYVVGHRNPDTDSICSAIAYAYVKKQLGAENVVAARAGAVNPETQYVLKHFGVEEPLLIEDLYPRLKDISLVAVPIVNGETKLRDVSHIFNEQSLRCLPIGTVDSLEGLVTVTDLAKCFYKELVAQEGSNGSVDYTQLLDSPVKEVMSSNIVYFKHTDLLEDVKAMMLSTNFRSYPVLQDGAYVGMITKDDLLAPAKQELILVDHNERAQIVEGSEEAEIIEIIDHHRFGGLNTAAPINIVAEAVGCTATIVSNIAWNNGLELPKEIAGLLWSAIISDTLYFRSPTVTQKDKDAAAKLQAIAGIEDPEVLAMEILKSGSVIATLTPAELARTDMKEFGMGSARVTVSQVNILGREQGLEKAPELLEALEELRASTGMDLTLLMVTDILSEGTDLLVAGENQTAVVKAFGEAAEQGRYYLPGVLSRKKQIIPQLTEAFE